MKKFILIIVVVLVAIVLGVIWKTSTKKSPISVTNFAECVAEGNAVMESYPRQCISRDGAHFTEDVGNELNKSDLIRVSYPRPNEEIKSPVTIKGEARGSWFFEASFPVFLTDWDGKIIAQGHATAKGEWMTTEFVPFEAILTFTPDANTYSNKGTLILKKDNPSGLPQNDDALEIPVIIGGNSGEGGYIIPYNSGVVGKVSLGPTCPVMQNPPDPQCADKPYQTSISISRVSDTSHVFTTTQSKSDGTFKISLPPDDYLLSAKGGTVLPRCSQTSATVKSVGYTDVTITCDTGIR